MGLKWKNSVCSIIFFSYASAQLWLQTYIHLHLYSWSDSAGFIIHSAASDFLHQSGNRCIMKNAYHDLLKPEEMALIFSFKDHKFEVTIHLI